MSQPRQTTSPAAAPGQPLPPAGALSFRDSPVAYGQMSRFLHWSIAALLLYQFLGMGLRAIFDKQPWLSPFVSYHQPVGTVLFVLIVMRVIWALSNRANRPAHGSDFLGRAASVGHGLIYVVMLAVPAIALVRAYGNDRVFAPFGFTVFPAQQPPVTWAVDLGGALHGELGWVLGVLVLGHVAMVGIHESMWRDGTLARMKGPGRSAA